MGELGSGAGIAGAAIAAGIGVAVKSYADFDQAMSAVSATGQDARDNLGALREAALQAGADTKFSATEAAQGVEELAKAGVSATDVLSGGLNGALDMAAAGNMRVGDAAEITAKTLNQFSLEGKDASHVADLLAAGAGKSVGEVSDMGFALSMAGTTAAQYGVSVEETVGSLALFASNALVGSDAGTSFKQMLLQLASPTEAQSTALEAYNIAAYDAQGNFVGMAGLADQLKERLGGLSQEQQNSALKTIFGADAIRTATVLMKEGGDGVRQWTKDVNEQGYASKAAGEKMNNLSGDVEELSGSFETAMIKIGKGADGPLRNLVKGVNDAVDSFSGLPDSSQQAILAVGGITSATTLAIGGMGKLVSASADVRESWGKLHDAHPKLTAGLGRLTGAIGAAGAAFAAWEIAQVIHDMSLVKVSAEDAATAVERFADSGREVELNSFFKNLEGYQVKSADLAGALAAVGASLNGSEWDKFRGAGQQFLNLGGDIKNSRDAILELDKALAKMDADKAEQAFADIAVEVKKAGLSAEQAAQIFPQMAARIQQAARAKGEDITSTEAMERALSGYIDLAKLGVGTETDLAEAHDKAGAAADAQAKKVDELAEAQNDAVKAANTLSSVQLQLSGSAMGVEEAIDAANKQYRESAKVSEKAATNLDITTKRGRENKTALDGIASAAIAMRDAQMEADASVETMNTSMAHAREEFIKVAEKMGMSEKSAEALADKYGLLDVKVKPTVEPQGVDAASAGAKEAKALFENLKGVYTAQLIASGMDPMVAGAQATQTALDAIPGEYRAVVSASGATAVREDVRATQVDLSKIPGRYAAKLESQGVTQVKEDAGAAKASVSDYAGAYSANLQALGIPKVVADTQAATLGLTDFDGTWTAEVRTPGMGGAIVDAGTAYERFSTLDGTYTTRVVQPGMQAALGDSREARNRFTTLDDTYATKVTQPGMPDALRDAREARSRFTTLDDTYKTNIKTPGMGDAIRDAGTLKSRLDALDGRIINIGVEGTYSNGGRPMMGGTFATGGYVRGAGTGTSDSIFARLSNGEFVVKASSVERLGLDRLNYMNTFGELPKFASGGYVSPQVHYSTAPRFSGGGYVSQPSSVVQQVPIPTSLTVVDADGALIGRMRVVASDAISSHAHAQLVAERAQFA